MISELNNCLEAICSKINIDSVKYYLSMRVYRWNRNSGLSLTQIMLQSLYGKHDKESQLSNLNGLIEQLQQGLDYQGIADAFYPNVTYLRSKGFAKDKKAMLQLLRNCFEKNDNISRVYLDDHAHPFNPVYWDMAYLIRDGDDAYVFIGSASD